MIFPLAVNHQPLAAKDNEGQQDKGIEYDAQGAEIPEGSDTGTRMRQPSSGPTKVPLPPITVAAMGSTEKSRQTWKSRPT
jgi:hypothetical protein